jgi:hypothetical protein
LDGPPASQLLRGEDPWNRTETRVSRVKANKVKASSDPTSATIHLVSRNRKAVRRVSRTLASPETRARETRASRIAANPKARKADRRAATADRSLSNRAFLFSRPYTNQVWGRSFIGE